MRRVVIAIISGVIVLISAVGLLMYVSGADSRASAKYNPVTVLVATSDIPKGTTVDQARSMAQLRTVPASVKVPDALTAWSAVAGKVVTADIKQGEQLVPTRFGSAEAAAAANGVAVSPGMQTISFQLDPQRLNGGVIKPGDLIGIFVTADFKSVPSGSAAPGGGESEPQTKLFLSKVQVTDVVGAVAPAAVDPTASPDASASAQALPTQQIMLTVAVSSLDAEKLVWALESGKVWISLQNDKTNTQVPAMPIKGSDVVQK